MSLTDLLTPNLITLCNAEKNMCSKNYSTTASGQSETSNVRKKDNWLGNK